MKAIHRGASLKTIAVALLACSAGVAVAGTEGSSSTFYGVGAGNAASATAGSNTFIGVNAGKVNASQENTFVGRNAGTSSTFFANTFIGYQAGADSATGSGNTALGWFAGGNNVSGSRNVFLGYAAGSSDFGSNKLYIDNCLGGGSCNQPLIYGEFDNRRLHLDGVVRVTANRGQSTVKSQLHFSVTGADVGGWMTSAADNNFFTSSGARYDAMAGGWIQRSADGKAVIAGSGAAGFRVLTSSGGAVGGVVVPVSRLHIDFDGLMGVNTAPAAGRAINTSTGAYLSSGGVWTNASSRELKEHIERLDAGEAMRAFAKLDPVRFRYRDEAATHVGFIAEDVPELVATADRKGLSPMDVVAVLTKVVQEKSRVIDRQESQIAAQSSRIAVQAARFAELEARFGALAAEVRAMR